MLLAEMEAYYSRPIAPTRRVALGEQMLPVDPAPGFGGILLGAVVARFASDLDEELLAEMYTLVGALELGLRIPQPRLRHRLQTDRVGLRRATHRLFGEGEELEFSFDEENGSAAQHVLCALYAAGAIRDEVRPIIMGTIRKGLAWHGDVDERMVAHLSGRGGTYSATSIGDPVRWALEILDLGEVECVVPTRKVVQQAFRDGLRDAHPDHGGEEDEAAGRIAELAEARRILLG